MAGEARIGERAAPSSSATGSALSHAPSARRPPAYTTSLAAGALSGLSVDLLFYPIDTLKTRLQSSQGFLKAGGFSGIYRGIGSVAVGSAPGAAVFFVSYEGLKPLLSSLSGTSSGEAAPGVHMGAASIAEVAACLIRVPTEVIKSRQQTSHYGIKASSLAAAQAVWRQTGLRGLYTGFAGTISREIPFTCIQFPLYEYLKLSIARSELLQGRQVERRTVDSDTDDERRQARLRSKDARSIPTWQAGLAGSVAGSIAAGLTTPLDVAKTRIMLGRRHGTSPRSSTSSPSSSIAAEATAESGVNTRILPTLRHIATHEGGRALFAGFVPRTLWIGLGGAVFLGTFEAGVKIIEGEGLA